MLLVASWIFPSPIHGYGCFTAGHIPAGQLVWIFNARIDQVLFDDLSKRERLHAYGSNASGRFILCGDNAAWINFSEKANLIEAEKINDEFALRSSCEIRACTELTVFPDSDTDYPWKMNRCMKDEDS
jgi:hypothetical protein